MRQSSHLYRQDILYCMSANEALVSDSENTD